ncbi:beta family protein [Fibrella forsythiae]|uniref:Beta family protein n=1 Tax=Fibrella forsythiae TaxID=2817061 RepID=A0ABS3JT81_9BACT|nr:beta family protein [Fibrella forsythiae]MBO0953224.1 beta family protein [Fibrella forsythiae]
MSSHLYTPILVSKEGELIALSYLLPDQKDNTIPLIQLIPDAKEDRVKDYVQTRIKPLVDSWSFPGNRIYLDSSYLQQYEFGVTQDFFNKLKNNGINIIPVVYPDSADWILSFYKDFLSHGICLRIRNNNINAQTIINSINRIKSYFSIDSSSIDLVIDFGVVTASHEASYANSLELIALRLAKIEPIRQCIMGAGSFPADLTKFVSDTKTPITRVEWTLWKNVKNFEIGSSRLIYADYGNAHPNYDLEAVKHQGTCSIKYTTENHFVIFRGQRAQDHALAMGQYRVKAAELLQEPYYSGQSFSWGDQFITDCAEGREGPGTPAIWVRVTQNHHFVKTLELLRKG